MASEHESNRGKIDWYIDGVLAVSGQDWYVGSLIYNVVKTASVTVSGSGLHTVKGVTNGKNASSSNRVFSISSISLD